MAEVTHIKSGSKIGAIFTPVDILEIGSSGRPTEIIVHNGKMFLYNTDGQTLIDGGYITTHAILADTITAAQLNVTNIADITTAIVGTMYLGGAGTASSTLDVGILGKMLGGQTDYDTGVGFFIGYSTDNYKFSFGDSDGDKVTWDGFKLKVVGVFEATSPINLMSYVFADLPIAATEVGFNSPSSFE